MHLQPLPLETFHPETPFLRLSCGTGGGVTGLHSPSLRFYPAQLVKWRGATGKGQVQLSCW